MNQYIPYFLATTFTVSLYLYYILQNQKAKSNTSKSNLVDIGFGFIPNNYPILTIYISGNYFKNKRNPLPLSHPEGITEDSYFLASFDNSWTDYIGAVPNDKMLEIKKELIRGTSDELLQKFSSFTSHDVDKKYYEDRIKFAETYITNTQNEL